MHELRRGRAQALAVPKAREVEAGGRGQRAGRGARCVPPAARRLCRGAADGIRLRRRRWRCWRGRGRVAVGTSGREQRRVAGEHGRCQPNLPGLCRSHRRRLRGRPSRSCCPPRASTPQPPPRSKTHRQSPLRTGSRTPRTWCSSTSGRRRSRRRRSWRRRSGCGSTPRCRSSSRCRPRRRCTPPALPPPPPTTSPPRRRRRCRRRCSCRSPTPTRPPPPRRRRLWRRRPRPRPLLRSRHRLHRPPPARLR
eukprot:COSAG04_NODE_1488_length_6555_cov_2.767658_5_plen_251_part_00